MIAAAHRQLLVSWGVHREVPRAGLYAKVCREDRGPRFSITKKSAIQGGEGGTCSKEEAIGFIAV